MALDARAALSPSPAPGRGNKGSFVSLLLHPALVILWESRHLADDFSHSAGCDSAQAFAASLDRLRRAGLTEHQLHWLVDKGYAEVRHTPHTFLFEGVHQAVLSTGTQVALTPAGCVFLEQLSRMLPQLAAEEGENSPAPIVRQSALGWENSAELLDSPAKPSWDRVLRELRWGRHLVKQFRVRANNQELILSAFEEENWPVRIDDPLPPRGRVDGKLRLRDTISSLNRHQHYRGIRFRGDGTGRGIRWEAVPTAPCSL